jgi:fumarate reductase flavoprotein subunit
MAELWDVAVVGAGTAGIPVALFAAGRGARVILVEAADVIGGTLHLSNGSMGAAASRLQAARGIADSPDEHFDNCIRLNRGTGDPGKLRLWIDNAADTLAWLLDNGLAMDEKQPEFNPATDPYDRPRVHTAVRGGLSYLECLSPLLDTAVAEGRIDLRLSTRMTDLLTDDKGGVRGLRATSADGASFEIAAKNVVLASGGYSQSAKLWRELHNLPRRVYAYPHSNGDGLLAARAIGARVAHAEHYLPTIGGTADADVPNKYWIQTLNSPRARPPWEICVNLDGARFMTEDRQGNDRRQRILRGQREQSYWIIYDERIRREAPPLFMLPEHKVERMFRYHEDFQRAASIEALARACGLDAAALKVTIDRYNAGQAVGADELEREFLPAPIAEPPFYAVKHHGIGIITFGGLVADDRLNVLGADGPPIPGLYAAGEVLGAGMYGNAFLGGMMVAGALTFGRLLGERILEW